MPSDLQAVEALGLFFRHRCNVVLAGLTVGTAGLGLWLVGPAGVPAWIAWTLAGAALWPLLEYVTHRWVLHAHPLPWAWALRIQRRLHYDHHVDPRRLELLFAPLWFTIPTPLALGLVYGALLPPVAAAGLMFGHMTTLLFYEWIHFLSHVPYQPRSAHFRRLKTLHTRHHFKNEHYWFGVTASGMDRLLGTDPEAEAVPTSPTVRALHGETL